MNQNDINRTFTEKVTELIAQGYQINPATMSGSQGEHAHVDLRKGCGFERVRKVAAISAVLLLPAQVTLPAHLHASFHIGEVVLSDLGKLDFKENFQLVIPDGIFKIDIL